MARSYLEEMRFVIGHNESSNSYTSINLTDVISIGLFNWYGARALNIARQIVTADPSGSETALSGADTPLYTQINSGDNNVWNNYYPGRSQNDLAALRLFLDLSASHNVQDSQALIDSEAYSSQAKSRNITNAACQIYFADLYNQSPKQAGNIINSVSNRDDLTALHNAAMANPIMKKYKTRRDWTYNELVSWAAGGGVEVPETPPINPPNGNGGGNLPPNAYAITDYILIQNSMLVRYSEDTPTGKVYTPVNNIFIPKGGNFNG